MLRALVWLALLRTISAAAPCPSYTRYANETHPPLSTGKYRLPFQRPDPGCRTFNSTLVEDLITHYGSVIKDPDLYRLFENTFPNTLDTTIAWQGKGKGTDGEELAFVVTGDIPAMWLRDSANQMLTYISLLTPSSAQSSLSRLFRGVINMQSRSLIAYPYCQAFGPPPESNLEPILNFGSDTVRPFFSFAAVWECKYELDSLASFLHLSAAYHATTRDTSFFQISKTWTRAVGRALDVAEEMQSATFAPNGSVIAPSYTFTRRTRTTYDTLPLAGVGNPVRHTGLVRSAFRPSDDASIFGFNIPVNMYFCASLSAAAEIAAQIGDADLAERMRSLAAEVKSAIAKYGVYNDPVYGPVYAYEIDGFGGMSAMDDANMPSLLGAPLTGFLNVGDSTYQSTRRRILSPEGNPFYMHGAETEGVGSPHSKLGWMWPLAQIIRVMTSEDDDEIVGVLRELVGGTAGKGLVHESVDVADSNKFTRPWFAWANGLFGQMILDLQRRRPEILEMSFQ